MPARATLIRFTGGFVSLIENGLVDVVFVRSIGEVIV